jgi:hypothetical protein
MIYHPEMHAKKFVQVHSSPTYRYYSWNWETLLRKVISQCSILVSHAERRFIVAEVERAHWSTTEIHHFRT